MRYNICMKKDELETPGEGVKTEMKKPRVNWAAAARKAWVTRRANGRKANRKTKK